jgi:hypothetical protein
MFSFFITFDKSNAMPKNKTQPTDESVTAFLNAVENDQKRTDSFKILDMMRELSGEEPKIWGTSIIGFGTYHYKYASGREGDFLRIGFSPRKQNISLYLISGANKNPELLKQLGKHKTGKSCLYINKLADIDISILRSLIRKSLEEMKRLYP